MLPHVNTLCSELLNWNIKHICTIIFIFMFPRHWESAYRCSFWSLATCEWPNGICRLWVSLISEWNQHGTLQWRHNERDGVSNHQPHHCLLKTLFRCRSKKKSKLRVTGLCAGNSPVTGESSHLMSSSWIQKHHQRLAYISWVIIFAAVVTGQILLQFCQWYI